MGALPIRLLALSLGAVLATVVLAAGGAAAGLRTDPIQFTGLRAAPQIPPGRTPAATRPVRVKTPALRMTGAGR